jgi:hypothetical protein
MLRAKVLPEVLGQIVGDDVTACMYVLALFILPVLAVTTLHVVAPTAIYSKSYATLTLPPSRLLTL